jgi:hypothetical protein
MQFAVIAHFTAFSGIVPFIYIGDIPLLFVMYQNYVMKIAIFYQTTRHLVPDDNNLHINTTEL